MNKWMDEQHHQMGRLKRLSWWGCFIHSYYVQGNLKTSVLEWNIVLTTFIIRNVRGPDEIVSAVRWISRTNSLCKTIHNVRYFSVLGQKKERIEKIIPNEWSGASALLFFQYSTALPSSINLSFTAPGSNRSTPRRSSEPPLATVFRFLLLRVPTCRSMRKTLQVARRDPSSHLCIIAVHCSTISQPLNHPDRVIVWKESVRPQRQLYLRHVYKRSANR